jgi:hypothetical protein
LSLTRRQPGGRRKNAPSTHDGAFFVFAAALAAAHGLIACATLRHPYPSIPMADLSFFTLIAPALFGPSLGGLLDADSSPQQRQAYELVMCADQLGPRYASPYLQAATRLTSAEFVQQALTELRRQGDNARLRAPGNAPEAAPPTPAMVYECQQKLMTPTPMRR